MKKRPSREPLSNAEGEVRELTEADFNEGTFHPGRLKAPVKRAVSMRIDEDVLEFFKAQGGAGYQTRMHQVLADYVRSGERQASKPRRP